MTEQPPDWVTRVPSTPAIHDLSLAKQFQLQQMSQDQLSVMRDKWNEQIMQALTLAVTGAVVPTGTIGGAEDQLTDWSAGLGGDIREILTGIPDADDSDLGTWVLNFFNNPLGTLFPSAVPQIPGTKVESATGDPFQNIWDDILDTWNRFLRTLTGNPAATGGTPNDVETFIVQQQDAVYATQNSTITLANAANAPKNVPFWVSPNAFEDVSFPRSQIGEQQLSGNTGTGGAGGGSHIHPLAGGGLSSTTPLGLLPSGTLLLTTVRTTNNRVYNSVGFITDGANPPASVYCGLYRIDPTNGDMSLEYNFGNISANISTGVIAAGTAYDTRINTISDIVANEGDLWAVGLLPVGGSINVVSIVKTTMSLSGVFPRFASCFLGSQTSLPTTIDDSVQSDVTRRSWACIGQAVPEDISPITMIESFNTANVVERWTSPSWNSFDDMHLSTTNCGMGISNQQAIEAPVFTFSQAFMSSKLAKTLCHTNDQFSEIRIGNDPAAWNGFAFNQATDRVYIRCRNNGTAGAVMHIDSNGNGAGAGRIRIATHTGMNQIGTVRISAGGVTVNVGDYFKITAKETAGTTTYRGWQNSGAGYVPIPGGTWVDSGHVVGTGQNWRSVGFGTGAFRGGFGDILPCGPVDIWSGGDLTA